MLTKLKHYVHVPEYILYSLYCALILPDSTVHKLLHIDKILKLQKRALRIISHENYYRCHIDPLFIKHNILKVSDTFKLELGIFIPYSSHCLLQVKGVYFC